MNTLAELIEYHKMCAENERQMLEHAIEWRLLFPRAGAEKGLERHTAAVATLQRAVADIERLQKAWEATR